MTENTESRLEQQIEIIIEPWQSRREHFLKMCRELAIQRDRFTNGVDNETDLSAATRSIAAVTKFLIDAAPSAPQLAEVLDHLGVSLADLDSGARPPLLIRKSKPTRSHRPQVNEMRYAVASTYITLRIEEKCLLAEAVAEVTSLFNKYAVPLPGKTANALKDWRKRMLNSHDSNAIKIIYLKALDDTRREAAKAGSHPASFLWHVLQQDLIGKPTESKVEF